MFSSGIVYIPIVRIQTNVIVVTCTSYHSKYSTMSESTRSPVNVTNDTESSVLLLNRMEMRYADPNIHTNILYRW